MKFDLPNRFARMSLPEQLLSYAEQLDPAMPGSRRLAAVLREAADELILVRRATSHFPGWSVHTRER